MATATTGEEYKLLHSTPKLVKTAKLFSLIWILAVTVPALYFVSKHAESLKEYAVVRAVGEAIARHLNDLMKMDRDRIRRDREDKFMKMTRMQA